MTMDPEFAPLSRLDPVDLAVDIDAVSINPVIDGLLNTVSGLLAVLNEYRQILAVNDTFLKMLGITDVRQTLGLRPGEALGCIYHDVGDSGCGTSAYCASCGAAIALVSCLVRNEPIQRECALTVMRDGVEKDLFLRVRACPIRVNDRRMVLLFLQDITYEQQWEALGRVFFHDLGNIIYSLVGSSEILLDKIPPAYRTDVERVHRLSLRLAREVQMQKHLTQMADVGYQPVVQPVAVDWIFRELESAFASHPAAGGRHLVFSGQHRETSVNSDFFVLVRVLTNMITNALEASDVGETVRVWAHPEPAALVFCVWNHRPVDPAVVDRIFQRNISTKARSGRGLGTYSMRLFGETVLGGKIDFTTSAQDGTTFRFHVPAPAEG